MTNTQRKLLDWNKLNNHHEQRVVMARLIMEADTQQQEMMLASLEA